MSQEKKKFVVEIDAETYAVIENICEQIDEKDQTLINSLFKQSLKDFVTGYEELKEGYVEFGSMNLEISNAFTMTENEAYSHIE